MRKDNQEEFKKLLNEVQSKASSTDVNQLQDSYVICQVCCILGMVFFFFFLLINSPSIFCHLLASSLYGVFRCDGSSCGK